MPAAAAKKKPTARASKAAADLSALNDMIAADADAPEVKPDMLARIVSTAEEMRLTQAKADELTAKAAECTAAVKRLSEEVLPSLMDEAGVKQLALEDDYSLERGENVYSSISAANAPAAAAWLEKNGYGAIIKARIGIEFEKGDTKMIAAVVKALKSVKANYDLREGVHPQTLRAFVRESLEVGRKLPASIAVHIQPVVSLKPPKKSKTKTSRSVRDVPF